MPRCSCGSTQTRYDRSLGGREVCARCGRPSKQGLSFPGTWTFNKRRSNKADKSDNNTNYIAQFIALSITILATVLPSLPVIDRRYFISLANSNLPDGSPPGQFGDLTSDPVFQSVIKQGGQIILTTKLEDNPGDRPGDTGLGSIAGNWDPNTGTMNLRTGEYTFDQYIETLKHEAIHMAQSCKANSLKSASIPIGLPITDEGLALMDRFRESNPSYYNSSIEREAFSNELLDSREIAGIVDEQCGSKPWIPFFGNLRSILQVIYLKYF